MTATPRPWKWFENEEDGVYHKFLAASDYESGDDQILSGDTSRHRKAKRLMLATGGQRRAD